VVFDHLKEMQSLKKVIYAAAGCAVAERTFEGARAQRRTRRSHCSAPLWAAFGEGAAELINSTTSNPTLAKLAPPRNSDRCGQRSASTQKARGKLGFTAKVDAEEGSRTRGEHPDLAT
jgi:hypothetical protein